jgi:signal transduction histidine kinase
MAQVSNLLYQRYRFIALVVYAAVLFSGLVDWVYGGIGPKTIIVAPENFRFAIFVTAVLVLVGLELWGVGQASFAALNKVEPFPFAARLFLFIGACLVTDLNYSRILFLPILLYSYLAVNKRLSYFMAVLGVAALFGFRAAHIDFMSPPPRLLSANGMVRESPPTGATLGGGLIDRSMGSLITLLFTLLLARAMSQSIQAQQKLTGLLASLEDSHHQLKQYSIRVAELAATEERNRLARDIHDSLGHHLAAINIQLEKANAYRERDPNRAYDAVKHAQRTVQDALRDVRKSVNSLRKEGDTFSFDDALNDLTRRMHHSELDIALEQTGDSSHYSRIKLMTLYRVVQEGLTNVHKHANASQVSITIDFGLHKARLDLTDNGSGFDVAAWEAREYEQTTQGLTGLHERLSLVGGTFSITSQFQETKLMSSIPQADAQVNAQFNALSSMRTETIT